tara:strand:- start:31 stop:675 length:645 start_codon:yes stop_codon:yes gene_type:complete
MDEDIAIINSKSRFEKIKTFFLNNKKKIILFFSTILFLIIIFFIYQEYKKNQKIKISELYNIAVTQNLTKNKEKTTEELIDIVYKKDATYSPLSLYYIIDNNLIENKEKTNQLFDILINKTPLETEIKNLIIYKKALYNSDDINENDLIDILKPLINSKSVWKSHALYLIAEYFYYKGDKQKSKEFYISIVDLENANSDLRVEAKKRLNRDLSD